MSGLSATTVQRLAELEAKPQLAPVERGELRAMAHSKPTAEERARVNRLLSDQPAPTPPTSAPAPSGPAAYERGLQRGKAAGGSAYTRGTA